MGKWTLGLFGSIIVGGILWVLTTILFPRVFDGFIPAPRVEPPPQKVVRVECFANPPTIAPASTTEITLRVTRGGEPVEGAAVSLTIPNSDEKASGTTLSAGLFRVPWTAPKNSASSYVFPANVALDGVRTDKEELSGQFRTFCEIVVRR
jgi:hypothetical protein